MEDFLLKSNFIGKDGFVWWVGQIAPIEAWKEQVSGSGWGYRYKVRILGYHPYSTEELSDNDLPWAQVMLPPGVGTGGGLRAQSISYVEGDNVVGFFLDGHNAQIPIIMGSFGRSSYQANNGQKLPFGTYSGLGENIPKPSAAILNAKENNDASSKSSESPPNLPPAQAKKQKPESPATATSTTGKVVDLPCGAEEESTKGSKGTIKKIKTAIEGFVEFLQDVNAWTNSKTEKAREWIKEEIDIRAEQITKLASGLVSEMVKGVFTKIAPVLGQGLNFLYVDVFGKLLAATGNPIISHGGAVAAQTATLPGVKALSDLIGCITNLILAPLENMVKEILQSVADNILNFVDCVADQTVGAMINGIISLITESILPALEGISKILQFFENFNFNDFMRNTLDAILDLVGLSACFKKKKKDKYGACKYKLGYGPVKSSDLDLGKLTKGANIANAAAIVAQSAGVPLDGVQDIVGAYDVFSNAISDPENEFLGDVESCFAGIPTICKPPTINIFGGGGEGASAIPIMGALFGNTGSVIDVRVTNPGSGYTFPPFVEVVDNCNQGYGCVARATIKNGQIDTIYVVSEGENYPVDEIVPQVVTDVNIINPGIGYEDGDRVVDNQGNEYDATIQSGSIIKVSPINSKDITNIPILRVISDTGSGALMSANLGDRSDGEVKKVIDCII